MAQSPSRVLADAPAKPCDGAATARPSWLLLSVLVAFVVACVIWAPPRRGDDLSSSYIGCRLLASGNSQALYAHDAESFDKVGSLAWTRAAEQAGFTGMLHPYVQTPAWAQILQPVCTRLSFRQFKAGFFFLDTLAIAATLLLLAVFWAPRFTAPLALGALTIAVLCSEPLRYCIFLGQTHPLFLLLAVSALILAERGRPAAAGTCLAIAATVKLTPGYLLFYWLGKRQWKAAAWFGAVGGAITLATLAVSGSALFVTYLSTLRRISDILLVSYNNQSLAAGITRLTGDGTIGLLDWHVLPLSASLKLLGLATALGVTYLAGYWEHRYRMIQPMGACLALIAITIGASLAWSHYFLILIAPIMLLLDRHGREGMFLIPIAAAVALNFRPLALDQMQPLVGRGILNSFLLSALMLSILLIASGWGSQRTAHGSASHTALP